MTGPAPDLEEIFRVLEHAEEMGVSSTYGYEWDDVDDSFIVITYNDDGTIKSKARAYVTFVDRVEEQWQEQ